MFVPSEYSIQYFLYPWTSIINIRRTVYTDTATASVGDFVKMHGQLRFMRQSENTMECEVTSRGQAYVMVFSFNEVLSFGTGIGDEIMCSSAAEAHCLYVNIKPPKKQITLALETVDFRDSLFISLVILMASDTGRHMEQCVTPNVSISIDMSKHKTALQPLHESCSRYTESTIS